MNACSSSAVTLSLICFRTGSSCIVSIEPPRLSSQFADQWICMALPVSSDMGRATGVCSPCGADSRVSYSYVHGS